MLKNEIKKIESIGLTHQTYDMKYNIETIMLTKKSTTSHEI
jgi:hypothetical protein